MNLITQHLTAAPAHRDSREGGICNRILELGQSCDIADCDLGMSL